MNKILLSQLDKLLSPYQKLYLGYSGGVDSEVLLYLLRQNKTLKAKLTAIHINHNLSPNAGTWESHCKTRCKELNIPFVSQTITVSRKNLEENARKARYHCFKYYITENSALLTAHHRQDQIETFFLNLFRGAGLDGLSCMPISKPFAEGTLIRPLLNYDKSELIDFAKLQHLTWVEDESNQETVYRRNFIRQQLLPQIMNVWPGYQKNIARSIKHLQSLKQQNEQIFNEKAFNYIDKKKRLSIAIKVYDNFQQANIIRCWLKYLGKKLPRATQIAAIINQLILGKTDSKAVILIDDYQIRRHKDKLYCLSQSLQITHSSLPWCKVEQRLYLPHNLGHLSLIRDNAGPIHIPKEAKIDVRFRQGGEIIMHQNCSKSLKKILQTLEIPYWERNSLPLLFVDNKLIAIADLFFASPIQDKNTLRFRLKWIRAI